MLIDGRYRLDTLLGAGGMGTVHLGHGTLLERRVAIKLLPDEAENDAHARARFRREALAAAALDHPFICKIFEVGEDTGRSFIVMEYIEGRTFETVIAERNLTPKQVLDLSHELAPALDEAHRRGVIHRDVKPSNIMLTTQGHVKVLDFGLAKAIEEGRLFDASGAWKPALRVEDIDVPEGVRLVISRRLERLGEDARKLLSAAAVIGRSFPLDLLQAVVDQPEDSLLDAVEAAGRAQLLQEERGREARYSFVHELIRSTLLADLSLPRRQRLHLRIAGAIERRRAASIDVHVSALAHHLYQALSRVRWPEREGTRAFRGGDPPRRYPADRLLQPAARMWYGRFLASHERSGRVRGLELLREAAADFGLLGMPLHRARAEMWLAGDHRATRA